jgi:hypothetical protein
VAGCGGGGSSGSSSSEASSSTSASTSSAKTSPSETSPSEGPKSEPSAEFLGKGKNGKLAKVGKEASAEEREAATKVLQESFAARETRDWTAQCETLAPPLIKQIEKAAGALNAAGGCAKALEAGAKPVPTSSLASTLTGPIAALRVEGNNGLAFWHGPGGKDYVIPMGDQGGEWKLLSLQEQPAP